MRSRQFAAATASGLVALSLATSSASAAPGLPHQLGSFASDLDGLPTGAPTSIATDAFGGLELTTTDLGAARYSWGGIRMSTSPGAAAGYVVAADGVGYVTRTAATSVEVLDTATGLVVHHLHFPVGLTPGRLALDPTPAPDLGSSRVLWVLDAPDGQLIALDRDILDGTDDGNYVTAITVSTTVTAVAVKPDHSLLLLDSSNNRVLHYTDEGIYLGFVSPGFGPAGSGDYRGMALDGAGYLYLADHLNDRIVEVDLNGTYVGMFGRSNEYSGQSLAPPAGELDGPIGVAVNCKGTLYVLDVVAGNGKGRVVAFSGVAAPAGACAAEPSTAFIGTQQGNFLTVDRADNTYASAYGRVEKYDVAGHQVTTWGSSTPADAVGQFGLTTGLATAPNGDVYVASWRRFQEDSNGLATFPHLTPKVLVFRASGAFVREFSSAPAASGTGSSKVFVSTGPIAIRQSDGHLFVDDFGLGDIQEFDAAGKYVRELPALSAIPGNNATDSPFVTALTLDRDGNLLVAARQRAGKSTNNVSFYVSNIQRFTPAGVALSPLAVQLNFNTTQASIISMGVRPDRSMLLVQASQGLSGGVGEMFEADAAGAVRRPGITAGFGLGHSIGRLAVDCVGKAFLPEPDAARVRVVRYTTAVCKWLPTAVTGVVISRSTTALKVRAQSNPSAQVTKVRVLWGLTSGYGHATAWVTLPSDNILLTRDIVVSGLTTKHSYHYRVEVTNASGTTRGVDRVAATL
jgi:hypothetical protein